MKHKYGFDRRSESEMKAMKAPNATLTERHTHRTPHSPNAILTECHTQGFQCKKMYSRNNDLLFDNVPCTQKYWGHFLSLFIYVCIMYVSKYACMYMCVCARASMGIYCTQLFCKIALMAWNFFL